MVRYVVIIWLLAITVSANTFSFTVNGSTADGTIDDSYINGSAANQGANYGNATTMYVAYNFGYTYPIVKFPTLSDSLAIIALDNIVVDSCKITMVVNTNMASGDTGVSCLQTVKASWVEGDGTDGVTWLCKNEVSGSCFDAWGTAGCLSVGTDYYNDAADTFVVSVSYPGAYSTAFTRMLPDSFYIYESFIWRTWDQYGNPSLRIATAENTSYNGPTVTVYGHGDPPPVGGWKLDGGKLDGAKRE